ncbi:MAG: Smr/MutS family protein [Myxococcota bacterium]
MGSGRDKPFNNPFAALQGPLADKVKATKKARKAEKKARIDALTAARPSPVQERPRVGSTPPPAPPEEDADLALFLQAVEGTQRLDGRPKVQAAPPPPSVDELPVFDEDAEALAELAGLVDGRHRFDIRDGDEFIEGSAEGLDRRVLQKLKRGEFAFRSHLDLHGMTKSDARAAVERFLLDQWEERHRCVLIVHGRGLNSKDQVPVLKEALTSWLQRGKLGRRVLAFCTARPHDGGAGAMYVLMRR